MLRSSFIYFDCSKFKKGEAEWTLSTRRSKHKYLRRALNIILVIGGFNNQPVVHY